MGDKRGSLFGSGSTPGAAHETWLVVVSRPQVRQQLEASVADHQARSKAADVREAQLLGRVEVLLLERQQLQATADERGARCAALQAEADQAAERARHLRERLHAMEHEMARRTADLGEGVTRGRCECATRWPLGRGRRLLPPSPQRRGWRGRRTSCGTTSCWRARWTRPS